MARFVTLPRNARGRFFSTVGTLLLRSQGARDQDGAVVYYAFIQGPAEPTTSDLHITFHASPHDTVSPSSLSIQIDCVGICSFRLHKVLDCVDDVVDFPVAPIAFQLIPIETTLA